MQNITITPARTIKGRIRTAFAERGGQVVSTSPLVRVTFPTGAKGTRTTVSAIVGGQIHEYRAMYMEASHGCPVRLDVRLGAWAN